MLNEDEKAVRRVLKALEAMLLGRGQAAPEVCPSCAQVGERYCVSAGELETNRRLAGRARLHLEAASEHVDRALEHVDLLGERLA